MAEFVVEVCVIGIPRSNVVDIVVDYVQDAQGLPNRHRRQQLAQPIGIAGISGVWHPDAIAQLFNSGARGKVCQIGLSKAAVDAGLAVGGKHHCQSDGRDQDNCE